MTDESTASAKDAAEAELPELAKETLEDLDPGESAEHVHGGGQSQSCEQGPRGGCVDPKPTDTCWCSI